MKKSSEEVGNPDHRIVHRRDRPLCLSEADLSLSEAPVPVPPKDNHGGLSLQNSSPVASNPHSSVGTDTGMTAVTDSDRGEAVEKTL